MRRLIRSIMYRTTRRALAYPPIYTVVRDFLKDNPEALFRILSGRNMVGAFAAQSQLLDATLRSGAFKRSMAERPELGQVLVGLFDGAAAGHPQLYAEALQTEAIKKAAAERPELGTLLVDLFERAVTGQPQVVDAALKSEAIKKAFSERSRPATWLSELLEDGGEQPDLFGKTVQFDTFKQAVAERPDLARLVTGALVHAVGAQSTPEGREGRRARIVAQLIQPATESYAYAREIGALTTGLAQDHSLSGSGALLHAFMSWRAMSTHFSDDWRQVTNLFDGFSTMEQRGFKEILALIIERLSQNGVVKLKGGEFRFLDAPSFADTCDEILAREQYHFLTDAGQPYVLDCGVNAGLAIYYVKQLHPNAIVIGFEPHEATANLARENVERLGLKDVTIHNAAVAGREGEMQLAVSDNPLGHHLALTPSDVTGAEPTVSVKVDVLSKYVDRPVDFIKLDVEGAECDVLFELGVERLKLVRNMFCEFHIDRPEQWGQLGKVLDLLREAGLQLQLEGAGWAQRSRTRRPLQHAGKHLSLSIYARR